jgi:hypothetical protein
LQVLTASNARKMLVLLVLGVARMSDSVSTKGAQMDARAALVGSMSEQSTQLMDPYLATGCSHSFKNQTGSVVRPEKTEPKPSPVF